MKILGISTVALALSLASACGGTSASGGGTTTPAPGDATGAITSTDVASGEAVWAASCGGCHSETEGAYGPRVHGIAWTPDRMRGQIREGSGRMPGFDAAQIAPNDLENLLAYLQSIGGVN